MCSPAGICRRPEPLPARLTLLMTVGTSAIFFVFMFVVTCNFVVAEVLLFLCVSVHMCVHVRECVCASLCVCIRGYGCVTVRRVAGTGSHVGLKSRTFRHLPQPISEVGAREAFHPSRWRPPKVLVPQDPSWPVNQS